MTPAETNTKTTRSVQDVEELARRADNPALAQRRRGAWRVWSDGEVSGCGDLRGLLCPELHGARGLGLRFPHEAAGGGSYAWVTRRDGLAVHDALAELLGASGVARARVLRRGGYSPESED